MRESKQKHHATFYIWVKSVAFYLLKTLVSQNTLYSKSVEIQADYICKVQWNSIFLRLTVEWQWNVDLTNLYLTKSSI